VHGVASVHGDASVHGVEVLEEEGRGDAHKYVLYT
jgi:hypothetical protein